MAKQQEMVRALEEYNRYLSEMLKGVTGEGSTIGTQVSDLDQKMIKFSEALQDHFKTFAKTVEDRDRSMDQSWDKLKKQMERDSISMVSSFVNNFTSSFHSAVSSVIEKTSTSGEFGKMAGSLVGAVLGAFTGPAGMAIGSQIGSIIGKAVGDATEGARMTGAAIAPAVTAGVGMGGFVTEGGNPIEKYSAVGREYIARLLEIRIATAMTIEEADKLQKAYAKMGVGAGSHEAVEMAKLTVTYDQLFQMPSGTTAKMEEALITQFGKAGTEVTTVMGTAYDSLKRLGDEFKTHDQNIGRALTSGNTLAMILGNVTSMARTAGASLEGVEQVTLTIMEAVAGVGGRKAIGQPAQIVGKTMGLMDLLNDVKVGNTMLGEGGIKAPAIYEQFNTFAGPGGQELIAKVLENYSQKTGIEFKPGTETARRIFPIALEKAKQDQGEEGKKITEASFLLDIQSRYRAALEFTKQHPGSSITEGLMIGMPGRPGPDDPTALWRTIQATNIDKSPIGSLADAAKRAEKVPPKDRQEFTAALQKQADRAAEMRSLMDKTTDLMTKITNWSSKYWDLWKDSLNSVMGGQSLSGEKGAAGVIKDIPGAVRHMTAGEGTWGPGGMYTPPTVDMGESHVPLMQSQTQYAVAPFSSEADVSVGGPATFTATKSAPMSVEMHERHDMERERHHGTNDGRR